jgi:hypothetical protein
MICESNSSPIILMAVSDFSLILCYFESQKPRDMKLPFLLFFMVLVIIGCKKEPSPEQKKLETMRKYIVNDWTIRKMMVIKPASRYGLDCFNFTCNDNETYSFRSDSTFAYKGNPVCNNKDVLPGEWSLPKTDSLFIRFTGGMRLVCYEHIEVGEITAGRMKWIIIGARGNGIPNDTLEYTLVPRW